MYMYLCAVLIFPTSVVCICRITVFHFIMEDSQEEPTVTFMGEEPYLQYVRNP